MFRYKRNLTRAWVYLLYSEPLTNLFYFWIPVSNFQNDWIFFLLNSYKKHRNRLISPMEGYLLIIINFWPVRRNFYSPLVLNKICCGLLRFLHFTLVNVWNFWIIHYEIHNSGLFWIDVRNSYALIPCLHVHEFLHGLDFLTMREIGFTVIAFCLDCAGEIWDIWQEPF